MRADCGPNELVAKQVQDLHVLAVQWKDLVSPAVRLSRQVMAHDEGQVLMGPRHIAVVSPSSDSTHSGFKALRVFEEYTQ